MSAEFDPQPPDSDMIPWTPTKAFEHVEMVRDHFRENPDLVTPDKAVGALNIALTIMEHMSCPHLDCPMFVLDTRGAHKPQEPSTD